MSPPVAARVEILHDRSINKATAFTHAEGERSSGFGAAPTAASSGAWGLRERPGTDPRGPQGLSLRDATSWR